MEAVRRHADNLRADVDMDALIATGQTLLDYTDVLAREPRHVSEEAQKSVSPVVLATWSFTERQGST